MALPTHAQTLLGTVKDSSTQQPLPRATLTFSDSSGQTQAYTITSEQGRYQIELPPDRLLYLQVRFLGFQKQEKTVRLTKGENRRLDIALTPSTTALEEVEVTGKAPPITRKNDTIRYDVARYRDSTEVSLGDLLAQLPGVEVSTAGEVEVNGKKVDKLLIEGREFFGNNQKLATQNLSAKMVGTVEVYENYQGMGALQGFGDGKELALNVGIQEEYKGRITGRAKAGGGYEKRYTGGANLFQFQDKAQHALLTKANNTGEQVLSFRDYFKMLRPPTLSESDFTIDKTISRLLRPTTNTAERTSEMGALNLSWFPDETWEVKTYAILSRTEERQLRQTTTRFLSADSLPASRQQETGRDRILFGNLNINIEHTPSASQFWSYQLVGSRSGQRGSETTQNIQGALRQTFRRNDQQEGTTLSQQLKQVQRLGRRTLWYNRLTHLLTRTEEQLRLRSDTSFLGLPLAAPYRLQQPQSQRRDGIALASELRYRIPAHLLRVQLSARREQEQFRRRTGALFFADTLLRTQDYRLRMRLDREQGNLRYTLQLEALHLNLKTDAAHFDRLVLFPLVRLRWRLGMGRLRASYRLTNTFADAPLLLGTPEVRDFQSLRSGSLPLDFYTQQQRISASYFWQNTLAGTILNLSAFYTQNTNVPTTNTLAKNGYTESVRRLATQSEQQSVSVYWVQVLGVSPFSMRLQANYSRIKQPGFVAGTLVMQRSETTAGRLRVKSDFEDFWFNVKAGVEFRQTQNQTGLTAFRNRLTEWSPFGELRGTFASDWTWQSGLTYRQFTSNSGRQRRIWDLGAALRYRPSGKPYFIALRGANLLNLSSPEQLQVSANAQWVQETVVGALPGFIVLEAGWQW